MLYFQNKFHNEVYNVSSGRYITTQRALNKALKRGDHITPLSLVKNPLTGKIINVGSRTYRRLIRNNRIVVDAMGNPKIKIKTKPIKVGKIKVKWFTISEFIKNPHTGIFNKEGKPIALFKHYKWEDMAKMTKGSMIDSWNQSVFQGEEITWNKEATFNSTSNKGKAIIEALFSGEIEKAIKLIEADPWHHDNGYWAIKLSDFEAKTFSKYGYNTKIFVDFETGAKKTPDEILNKYKIYGDPLILPYTNYSHNGRDPGNGKCGYYCLKLFAEKNKFIKKIKTIDKVGITIKELIDVLDQTSCKYYLLNLAGEVFYSGNPDGKKNRLVIKLMIGNGHVYPCNNKQLVPKLIELERPKNDKTNQLLYTKNNRIYHDSGFQKIKPDGHYTDLLEAIRNIEVKDKRVQRFNFTIKGNKNTIDSLHYGNGLECKFEYDIKRAYYNCFMKSNIRCIGIFTVISVWEEYDSKSYPKINDYAYYLIKKSTLKRLLQYGIRDNFLIGTNIKFLIDSKMLWKNEIEAVKYPSYLLPKKEIMKCYDNWNSKINDIDDMPYQLFQKDKSKAIRQDIIKEHTEENSDDEVNIRVKEEWDALPAKERKKYEDQAKKQRFKFFYGLCAKQYITQRTSLNINSQLDLDLLNMYRGGKGGKREWDIIDKEIEKTRQIYSNFNFTNIANFIVSTCQLETLKTIVNVKNKTGILPCKIQVDGIGYTREIPADIIDNHIYRLVTIQQSKYWTGEIKAEKPNPAGNFKPIYFDYKTIYSGKNNNNKTFIGAPGSGKTFKGILLIKKGEKIDIVSSWTNRCVRRIDRKLKKDGINIATSTVFKLFCETNKEEFRWDSLGIKRLKNIKGKTIWIDEFSMIPCYYWNYIYLATKNYGTRFIFTGDTNQCAPVGEKPIKENKIGFILGEIIRLKEEDIPKEFRRNCQDLIKFRDAILENRRLEYKVHKIEDTLHLDTHIVYTHKNRVKINEMIMKERGLSFSSKKISKGLLITPKKSVNSQQYFKGERFRVLNRSQIQDIEFGTILEIDTKKLLKDFNPAYALTTHSVQGDEFKAYAIHEFQKMLTRSELEQHPGLPYTAVTRGFKFDQIHFVG